MKKVFVSLFLLISTLMLSSCQANWFGSHFDVPWYFIAVPVFVLFIVLYVIIVSKTYVCPKCKTEFKPKWYQIYITIHFNDSRIAKCPNCGRKGFCKRKDQWHLFCQHVSMGLSQKLKIKLMTQPLSFATNKQAQTPQRDACVGCSACAAIAQTYIWHDGASIGFVAP